MDLEDRLKKFTYVLVRSFEEKLQFWLKYLEDRPDILEARKPAKGLAAAASTIPEVGKPLAKAIKYGDQYCQNLVEKANAQTMADMTYFSDNNKEAFRMILIEGAFQIFCHYEHQFSMVSCNGGPLRAMRKLGSDATHRIFSFLLKDNAIKNLTPDLIVKGVVFGNSKRRSKKLFANGLTLTLNKVAIITSEFFANTGICIEEGDTITYYRIGKSTYWIGHRLIFPWEDKEKIMSMSEMERPRHSYEYQFIRKDKMEQLELLRRFVTTKDPIEDLKEFVRIKHDELEDLIKSASLEMKEVGNDGKNPLVTVQAEESVLIHLNGMVYETLKQILEEDRKTTKEEKPSREQEETGKRIQEEEKWKFEEPQQGVLRPRARITKTYNVERHADRVTKRKETKVECTIL